MLLVTALWKSRLMFTHLRPRPDLNVTFVCDAPSPGKRNELPRSTMSKMTLVTSVMMNMELKVVTIMSNGSNIPQPIWLTIPNAIRHVVS